MAGVPHDRTAAGGRENARLVCWAEAHECQALRLAEHYMRMRTRYGVATTPYDAGNGIPSPNATERDGASV